LRAPDAPINLIDRPWITNAFVIGIQWSDGPETGGSPVIDYRVWYDQGVGSMTVLEFHVAEKVYETLIPLTPGVVYTFKVQARNDFGFSDFSEDVQIKAAQRPDVAGAPATSVQGDDVLIDWNEPDDKGSDILDYRISIMGADGDSYLYQQDKCHSSDPNFITTSSCTVPIYILRDYPFYLDWGDSIYASVVSVNMYGDGDSSEFGNGAIITTWPDAPVNLEDVVEMRTES